MADFDFRNSPFAEELNALIHAEAQNSPPLHGVLFYGSSSIRLWSTLQKDFADLTLVNHGFGGSTLAECLLEFDRLVAPVRPRAIVLYAGDNDLDQGATPQDLFVLFQEFRDSVHRHLGMIPLMFISIKPSPSRFWNIARIREANRLVRESVSSKEGTYFVDVFDVMLNEGQEPRRELFTEDGLHMNRNGYLLWVSVLQDFLRQICLIK